MPDTKVYTISDSGIFLDVEKQGNKGRVYRDTWIDIIKYTNDDNNIDNNPLLSEKYCKYNESWKCFLPEYVLDKIKNPLMILHPLYDSYSILNIVGESCIIEYSLINNCKVNEKAAIEDYKNKIIALVNDVFEKKKDTGIWLPSAVVHGFFIGTNYWEDKEFNIRGISLSEAVGSWYKLTSSGLINQTPFKYIDEPWPHNKNIAYKLDYFFYLIYYKLIQ